MPLQYVSDAGVLVIPGAYSRVQVKNNTGGLATTGVIMLVGEANGGPHHSEEESLGLNAFGPDQESDILAKYGSGPIVDAFRAAVTASNDPNIVGSINRIIPVKTNTSTTATATLPAIGGGTHSTVEAVLAGAKGNLVSRKVESNTDESLPTTGSVVLAPPQVNTDVAFRVDGGAEVSATLTAADTPAAMQTSLDAVTGITATGGADRGILGSVSGSLTLTVDSGNQVDITISGASFAVAPTAGDILYIPTGSPFATANEGTYVVTSATTTEIKAYKLLDAAGAGDDLTPPTTEGPLAVVATTDAQAFSPVVITNSAAAVVPGKGKSLEIAESGSASFGDISFVFDSATASPPAGAATFVSTSAAPVAIAATSEYKVDITFTRQTDDITETHVGDGRVVLALGYNGTTGQAVIADGKMTITVTGGSGSDPDVIKLADFPTINDLVLYLNSLTGFSAAAGNATLGQRASTDLDAGTYDIASTHGARTGRIKQAGARLKETIDDNSVLVAFSDVTLVGQPDVASLGFLSGGARGGTTDSDVLAALTALESVRGNFVVPLFSRDATKDIADGLTDSNSTYTIDSVHANTRSHVLKMSQLKRRRNRQGFLSHSGTFAESQAAASDAASSRLSCTFQDYKKVNSSGTTEQFQPWMGAVLAAGMQSAGFYRAIVNKFINTNGVIHSEGSFNSQNDTDLEDALKSGLLPAVRDEDGGFRWVSDQTTYTRDGNFVFNSIQAVYAADVVASTTAQTMERAFVGQSVADINASLALTTLEGILSDMKRLKLIAGSDDAPKGFRNAKVKVAAPSMVVSVEIKLATAIYFIPISFLVTPVQSSAG